MFFTSKPVIIIKKTTILSLSKATCNTVTIRDSNAVLLLLAWLLGCRLQTTLTVYQVIEQV